VDADERDSDESDTGTSDTSEECDLAAVTADTLGFVDEVSPGSVSVTQEGSPLGLHIDASLGGAQEASSHAWLYVDLLNGTKVDITDFEAVTNRDWMLAFRRSEIRLNSNDSGSAAWLMTTVEQGFDEAATPGQDADWKQDDFITDECELNTFGQGMPLTAFGQWYDYDPTTHSVNAPENVTHVFYNPVDHSVYKLAITAYDGGEYDVTFASMF
jgi:hypothetical protein